MINGFKYVTIAADMSASHQHKIATWAVYIRHEGGTIKRTGQFEQWDDDTSIYELKALLWGLKIAQSEANLAECKLVVYTEVPHLLTVSRTKAGNIRKRHKPRYDFIQEQLNPLLNVPLDCEIRKVKAHTGKHTQDSALKKYYLNAWCDKESRRLLKKLVKEKQGDSDRKLVYSVGSSKSGNVPRATNKV